MGETHDESPIQIPYSENQVEKIVDIQEKQREAIEKMERSPQEEEQVQKILQSPDLIAALSDSNFMSNLKKCQQTPEELQKFITDPVYGPKFRLLLEAGLVSFS
jgi:predicted component of type VI protein secretion system